MKKILSASSQTWRNQKELKKKKKKNHKQKNKLVWQS